MSGVNALLAEARKYGPESMSSKLIAKLADALEAAQQAEQMAQDIRFLWDHRTNEGLRFLAYPGDVPVLRDLLDGTPLDQIAGFEWVAQARLDGDGERA